MAVSEKYLNICQVSLSGNLPIILENYKNFMKIYKYVNFYIICPESEKKVFIKKLKYKNCFIISENKIITFKKFKKISNKYLKNKKYFKIIQARLRWYYQQILKISFVIDYVEQKNKNIVIWDADTLILKKIIFFKKNYSLSYGTTSEFHRAYYDTNKKILKKLPNYFISSLAQFISLSVFENRFLKKKLSKFMRKKNTTSDWMSHIVFKAIAKGHENYNGSMFSEYELIGQSNLLYKKKSQKLISGLREQLSGKLTVLQKKIAKFFGYSYVAYEHTHSNELSKNMLNKKQDWYLYIKLLIRKTSNKFFRGIRHIILEKIYK